jgi:hypothetical protein
MDAKDATVEQETIRQKEETAGQKVKIERVTAQYGRKQETKHNFWVRKEARDEPRGLAGGSDETATLWQLSRRSSDSRTGPKEGGETGMRQATEICLPAEDESRVNEARLQKLCPCIGGWR